MKKFTASELQPVVMQQECCQRIFLLHPNDFYEISLQKDIMRFYIESSEEHFKVVLLVDYALFLANYKRCC